jgi:hypothetical protein
MAPNTRYPDHRHPPEEIYVVLSGGQWRQASGPWYEPGIGRRFAAFALSGQKTTGIGPHLGARKG